MDKKHKVYKIVLTGGPCGGKTTGQSRLCTFFENLGWKVFRVPETASVLLSGGIKFGDLSEEEAIKFQENLLKTMIQVENTFFDLGRSCEKDCLIICDRGAMDASAFISKDNWEKLKRENKWNDIDLRDVRYNQIIHMVSAANGAEDFYTIEDHSCRSEDVELAKELDCKAASAWIGHPYFDVIDNSTNFEGKMIRMIAAVCQRLGIDTGDRLCKNAKKLKFLVLAPLPADDKFPRFEDFEVEHLYLQSKKNTQVRLRKRGQKGCFSYIHTVRRQRQPNEQIVEVKTIINQRDYQNFYTTQMDDKHSIIYKKRRCFIYNNQYFQLDIYTKKNLQKLQGLMFLETYTVDESTIRGKLPSFLNIVEEVTGNPKYSMYNLSKRDDSRNGDYSEGAKHKFTQRNLLKQRSEEKKVDSKRNLQGEVFTNGHNGSEYMNGNVKTKDEKLNGGTIKTTKMVMKTAS